MHTIGRPFSSISLGYFPFNVLTVYHTYRRLKIALAVIYLALKQSLHLVITISLGIVAGGIIFMFLNISSKLLTYIYIIN